MVNKILDKSKHYYCSNHLSATIGHGCACLSEPEFPCRGQADETVVSFHTLFSSNSPAGTRQMILPLAHLGPTLPNHNGRD